jgi:hypothetical protein
MLFSLRVIGVKSLSKGNQKSPTQRPDPALKRLEKLVGAWNLKGRTLDSKEDNIAGWNTFEWLPGRFFLKSFGEIDFKGFTIKTLEIIRYDQEKKNFPSIVYSNVSGDALSYEWDVRGNSVVHSGLGATYTGIFSEDGNTLTGSWRPDKDTESTEGNSYDAVMTRRKGKTKTHSRSKE